MLHNDSKPNQRNPDFDWQTRIFVLDSKTGSGLAANMAGALTYLFGFMTGILFLLIERENQFVRFHAIQSILVSSGLIALYLMLVQIPVIGWLLGVIVASVGIVAWIILMQDAHSGKWTKVKGLGELAARQVN